MDNEIFHSGEKKLQKITGTPVSDSFASRIIKSEIIPGAVNFIESQHYFLVSSKDENEDIWISILFGEAGFLKVIDVTSFQIDVDKVLSSSSDIFYQNIHKNNEIGSLFIELASRRRFRINSTISIDKNLITANVIEAYPNCPKYIQKRFVSIKTNKNVEKATIEKGTKLNTDLTNWIKNADTFFVGSSSDKNKMDASHRGGKKGFIEIDGNTLRIPDYAGNNIYNTLGNFAVNKSGGLLFVDFKTGNTLQLTGIIDKIQFGQNSKEDSEKSGGTGRFWTFQIKKWILIENHHKAIWEIIEDSPFNP